MELKIHFQNPESNPIYRNGPFYLRNSNTNGYADLAFTYGQPGDIPVLSDWDEM